MIDLKVVIGIAKRFILPAVIALAILGMPFGYLYFKLHKDQKTLAALQVDLKKQKKELEAKNASQAETLGDKEKKLSIKDAELITMANQLKKSLLAQNQRDQEIQASLTKLQQEQLLAAENAKKKPVKKAEAPAAKSNGLKRAPEIRETGRSLTRTASSKKKKSAEKDQYMIAITPAKIPPPLNVTPLIIRPEETLPQLRSPGACTASDGSMDSTREMPRLKRKISATSFMVNFRAADKIPNLRNGFPEDLLRRLEDSSEFIPRNAALGISHPPLKAQSDSLTSTDAAREVAFKTGSQFVLSGVIDAGMGRTDYGQWIEVEIDAYDGRTGVLVAKRRQGMAISGENEIEIKSLFGTTKYFSTPFGIQFNELMKSLIKGIRNDLACMPFTAKITDIDIENNKIYIDGGTTSHVVPGDKFVAYHPARRAQSESTTNGLLGIQTLPVASVTIKQVFPLFSIGELSIDPKRTELHVGDFVSAQKIHMR